MPEPAYFSPDLFNFLRQLKKNNRREWFAKYKERYQKVVVEPALRFIGDFTPPLSKLQFTLCRRPSSLPRLTISPIYGDIRFSSDKRPFKTHIGIHFSHESGKDARAPVFYLHLEPDNCFAAAGVWHPDVQR